MKLKQMKYQSDRKIELLHNDKYKDYNYYILNLGTHPTAYVEIPKGNKLYGKNYNDIYDMGYDIDVHGGLTYSDNELMHVKSENWFIGWDYAHYNDYAGYYQELFYADTLHNFKKWTTEEIVKDCEKAIDQIIDIEKSESE